MGQSDVFALLQPSQKRAGFYSSFSRKRGSFDLAVKPYEGFIGVIHSFNSMSAST